MPNQLDAKKSFTVTNRRNEQDFHFGFLALDNGNVQVTATIAATLHFGPESSEYVLNPDQPVITVAVRRTTRHSDSEISGTLQLHPTDRRVSASDISLRADNVGEVRFTDQEFVSY